MPVLLASVSDEHCFFCPRKTEQPIPNRINKAETEEMSVCQQNLNLLCKLCPYSCVGVARVLSTTGKHSYDDLLVISLHREYRFKTNITFHDNDTVSFLEYRRFYFQPDMSNGKEEDHVVVPNILLLVRLPETTNVSPSNEGNQLEQ